MAAELTGRCGGKARSGARSNERGGVEAAVEAVGLRKRYAELEAVAGIDFRDRTRGEYFGFLGPNGAGKTTTLRMVQAVSSPSSGRLRVLGLDPVRDGKRVRARLGVCCPGRHPRSRSAASTTTCASTGATSPRMRGPPPGGPQQLLEFLALNEKRDRKIQELSGGMKRRLMIARALINEPELLVLDEPTTGLDPQARHLIWQKAARAPGARRDAALDHTLHGRSRALV